MIEARNSNDMTMVFRWYWGEKSAPKASLIFGRAASSWPNFLCQAAGSSTPYRMKPISSAGTPPKMNIHRQP